MSKLATFWSIPVHVLTADGEAVTIEGPEDAADFLRDHCPQKEGRHYRSASGLCAEAAGHNGRLEVSREAFIAAMLEAGLMQPVQRAPAAKAVATPRSYA
ncbi:DUF982 domain-containing protein [Martelella radicis]|uniref:DUF982 domain-containing protein n=1 Tax=Martelella radicis TaxID=1397476 RepID=A0A7W6KHF0_9HYPH|nr:DUF982 domain-containing protein [Martelella radicis]MBB4120259.1 hypothetical protein [Martelella radicis]